MTLQRALKDMKAGAPLREAAGSLLTTQLSERDMDELREHLHQLQTLLETLVTKSNSRADHTRINSILEDFGLGSWSIELCTPGASDDDILNSFGR